MRNRPESNVAAHRDYLADILSDRYRHSRGYQIKRWHKLFGERFGEHGWPLHLLPVLDPIPDATKWKTVSEATAMLIDRIPWCAERAAEWGGQRGKGNEEWFTEIFCRCPAEILIEALGLSEVVRLWQTSFIMSDFSDLVNCTDVPNILAFLDKVRLSYWHSTGHSGGHENDPAKMTAFYERQREILEGMRRFDFGVRGMIAYADMAYTMRWGPCVVNRSHYIDAHLAFNICMGDEHILTIAFTPTQHGIAVCQVQVKAKHGNRWLFGIGEHILDYALERMRAAFPDEPLLLVSGASAMLFVSGNYEAAARPAKDVLYRVNDLYSRPLARFDRASAAIPMNFIGGREFFPLIRKTA